MAIVAGGSTFGYAFSTPLSWRSWVEEYNPSTRVTTWYVYPKWYLHYAGWANSTGSNQQTWNVPSRMWARPAIEVYQRGWNYVPVSVRLGSPHFASPNWCYFP
jgi:hypothetical protein